MRPGGNYLTSLCQNVTTCEMVLTVVPTSWGSHDDDVFLDPGIVSAQYVLAVLIVQSPLVDFKMQFQCFRKQC